MPQERPNQYGHLLTKGGDIYSDVADQIRAAQRKADQEFFEKNRKLSPKFPDVAEALERQQSLRETIAARVLLAAFLLGLLDGIFVNNAGFVVALFGFVGFVITCLVSGSRAHDKRAGDNRA